MATPLTKNEIKSKVYEYLKTKNLVDPKVFELSEQDKKDGYSSVEEKLDEALVVNDYPNYAIVRGLGLGAEEELVLLFNDQGAKDYVWEELYKDSDLGDEVKDLLTEFGGDNLEKIYEYWGVHPEPVEGKDWKAFMTKNATKTLLQTTATILRLAAGTGLGTYRRGKVLTDIKAVQPGQLLVFESLLFKATNLVKVTQNFADKFYGIFVNPENPLEKSKSTDEEFVVYGTDLEKGEWYIALEPAPSDIKPEVGDAAGQGSKPVAPAPVAEPETKAEPEPEPVAEAVEKTSAKVVAEAEGRDPRITITYETITPESAEQGDAEDRGWIDEEGESMLADEFDLEEGLTVVDKAVAFLKKNYATEPSSSHFDDGVWYTAYDYDHDYETGATENRSYHLNGFTTEEAEEIFNRMTGKTKKAIKNPVRKNMDYGTSKTKTSGATELQDTGLTGLKYMLEGVAVLVAKAEYLTTGTKEQAVVAVVHDGMSYTPGAAVQIVESNPYYDVTNTALAEAYADLQDHMERKMTEEERKDMEQTAKDYDMEPDEYLTETFDGRVFTIPMSEFKAFIESDPEGQKLNSKVEGGIEFVEAEATASKQAAISPDIINQFMANPENYGVSKSQAKGMSYGDIHDFLASRGYSKTEAKKQAAGEEPASCIEPKDKGMEPLRKEDLVSQTTFARFSEPSDTLEDPEAEAIVLEPEPEEALDFDFSETHDLRDTQDIDDLPFGSADSVISGLLQEQVIEAKALASATGGEGDDGSAYSLVDDRNFTGVDEQMAEASVKEYLAGKATAFAGFEDLAGFVQDLYGIEPQVFAAMTEPWHNEDHRAIVAFICKHATKDELR